MSTVDRDWLEDVFFHDSIETLKRKHAKMIETLRKNPVVAQAEEAIRWMEVCANTEWPLETDDLRVLLRVNLLSRLKEQHQIIPFSPRMIREMDYISYAFDCFYAGQVFAPIKAEIVSLHHLHHVLAIRVWHTTTVPAPVNIKLFTEQAPLVSENTPRAMVDRLYDLYKRIEKERVRLSRLIQPEFYEDLQSEWTQVKRKLPEPEYTEEVEEEEEVKDRDGRGDQSDDSDNVFADVPERVGEEEEESTAVVPVKPLPRLRLKKPTDLPRKQFKIIEEED